MIKDMKWTWCLIHWAVQMKVILVRSKQQGQKYSIKYLWHFSYFLFCFKITMISVKNLFFVFLDMKGIGRGQAGFLFVCFFSVINQVQWLLRQRSAHFHLCQHCVQYQNWCLLIVWKSSKWSLLAKWKFDQDLQLPGDMLLLLYFTFERYPNFFIGHELCSYKSDPFSSHTLAQAASYESLADFYGY